MSASALEEVSAIAAIFCGKDECEVLEVSGNHPVESARHWNGYSQQADSPSAGPLRQDFGDMQGAVTDSTSCDRVKQIEGAITGSQLRKSCCNPPPSESGRHHVQHEIYPASLPNISVNSEQLTRTQCEGVRGRLLEEAKRRFSQPMVHELILWIQQNLKYAVEQAGAASVCYAGKSTLSTGAAEDDGIWIVLLHLDHMRAKGKYVKTVSKWCTDLKLTGRLMFMGKMILILLQGDRRSIKEYLILQKTTKVDVDSSGKKCKEKMISVLSETKAQAEHRRFQAFEVKEYSMLDELQNEFVAAGLEELFSEFVLSRLK